MPTVVSEMPKRTYKNGAKSWRTDKWLDEHLDGQIRRYVSGADYREQSKVFITRFRKEAKERGLRLEVVTTKELRTPQHKRKRPCVYVRAYSSNGQPKNVTNAIKSIDASGMVPVPLPEDLVNA